MVHRDQTEVFKAVLQVVRNAALRHSRRPKDRDAFALATPNAAVYDAVDNVPPHLLGLGGLKELPGKITADGLPLAMPALAKEMLRPFIVRSIR